MIAELLCHGKTREGYRSTCSWRLVHLSVDKCCLTLLEFFWVNEREVPFALLHCLLELLAVAYNARLEHIADEVVALTCTLAYTSEHRVAVVSLCDVVDKLHDEHGLAYAGTAEQTDLTALHVRLEEVDDLDTRSEHLLVCREVFELRRLAVDRISALHVEFAHTVDRLTDNVHHTALDLFTCRHKDGVACRHHFQATLQTVGVVHCHATNCVLTDMLLNLNDEFLSVRTLELQRFVYFRQHLFSVLSGCIEVNVDNRSDNLRDVPVEL